MVQITKPSGEHSCEFKVGAEEEELFRLAREYHEKTDQYDSIICSAKSVRGEALPTSYAEQVAINSNARHVKKSILRDNPHIDSSSLIKAIRLYDTR